MNILLALFYVIITIVGIVIGHQVRIRNYFHRELLNNIISNKISSKSNSKIDSKSPQNPSWNSKLESQIPIPSWNSKLESQTQCWNPTR